MHADELQSLQTAAEVKQRLKNRKKIWPVGVPLGMLRSNLEVLNKPDGFSAAAECREPNRHKKKKTLNLTAASHPSSSAASPPPPLAGGLLSLQLCGADK